ncbi:MAG: 2OG-Fe(II) oxygenase [Hydrogenophaga sp.]|uniref:2OG-Fe(II) oxygenase n=1 Tax=Hydrogenophaga sp. TaxID=1904254 RepID=UPI002717C37D|nr:2OG-Fe(II) oxygenase [Hydrogenophaga sp.]MDO9480955.1 2OG-Fe(II) oxygenase [Hydrogenophaga sp.]MDP1895072.1 2OG-Fe(II) oxygenase [Hydrogenophaga sp.]MDP2221809.1 2OG-Fe(II) oxygenase [Hydrogenophaga sp.]MDP3346464.1 2OG-Fe(II) oxygenase [Hydrogenophaga sp.]MDP3807500.1 2OG-Fe(II) oxygenase [Hydrogenophaga sp.]
MSQTITPELRRWLQEQAAAGYSRQSVLEALLKAGWQPALAATALASEWDTHQRDPASEVAAASPPPSQRLPDLDLSRSPRQIDAGDRWVDVIATLAKPRVVVLGQLLSAEECDALVAAARPRLARSLTVQTQTGGEELNPDRTSEGMFFRRGETELIARIEARIARLVNWPVDHGEGMQVLHYGTGAQYKPHYDYFDPAQPGTASILRRGGQRVATLVMYLSEPARGGGTTFPDAGLEVAPVRGNAVFFSYDRPHPATGTLHGGAPVVDGEKWVATKWLRERVFE